MRPTIIAGLALALASCGGPETEAEDDTTGDETVVEVVQEREREAPPASGPARDIQFPTVATATTSSGLALNTVQFGNLPIVYLRMTVQSGGAQDPEGMPGVAHFVSQMLKEGTRTRSSAQIAEEVEFLGANLVVGDDEENIYIMVRALAEHLDEAMELLADVTRNPRFQEAELRRLKARELDRLRLSSQQPRYLARRTIYRELYGEHPYAEVDTNDRRSSAASAARTSRAGTAPTSCRPTRSSSPSATSTPPPFRPRRSGTSAAGATGPSARRPTPRRPSAPRAR